MKLFLLVIGPFLPLFDYLTDFVNSILNITSKNEVDIAIGVAMLFNIICIPILLAFYKEILKKKYNMYPNVFGHFKYLH